MLFTNKIVKESLRNVASHHVESFNYAVGPCLTRINQYMLTAEVASTASNEQYAFKKLHMWFEDFQLKMPEKNHGPLLDANKMYPTECRLRSLTYSAPLYATVAWRFDDENEEKVSLCLGDVPVMVRSKFCNLHGLSEEELV